VPASAIGKPSAAEVPTASWIFTLHQVMKGTEMKAPPAPTMAESRPITLPTPKVARRARHGCGGLRLAFEEHLRRRERDEDGEQDAQRLARQGHRTCAPSSEPSTMPGASTLATPSARRRAGGARRTEEAR
jgi:hypothetical protein